jgi:hypothetical protein
MTYDKATLLRELLNYDPDTGVFTRKHKTGDDWEAKRWNRKWAGTEAKRMNPQGYISIRIKKDQTLGHRAAWLFHYGEWPSGHIDHINGIRNDNRICNLRIANPVANGRNRKVPKNSKTGIPGVCFKPHIKKFQVQIGGAERALVIGRFEDFFEACCARKSAEVIHGYHPNHGRFLPNLTAQGGEHDQSK